MLGALVALVAKGIVWWLPVVVIAVREIAMSVYRSVAGRHGISIPARNSAKFKTLVQDIAIGMCLAPPLAGHWTLLNGAMWVAAVLTVFTGAQYYVSRRAAAERAAGAPGPAGRADRSCASRSWPSAPSCCSGRSPTPTLQWLGEHLAAIGVGSHFHQAVGDNHERIVLAFRTALARSDAVIVCGGLGPTHDDITRDALPR